MSSPLRVLHLEDNTRDVQLVRAQLALQGLECEVTVSDSEPSFRDALARGGWDVVLCDLNLPSYDGLAALTLARAMCPGLPVIILSGTLRAEDAVRCVKLGATDYLFKDHLDRLAIAITRAIEEARQRSARAEAEEALRESERRFRSVFEHAGVGIGLLGSDGVYVRVNAKLGQILGYSPGELTRKNFRELTLVEDLPSSIEEAKKLLAGEITHYHIEKRYVRKDGSPIWLNLTVSPLMDAEGKFEYALVVAEDIDGRVRAEDEARQALTMIEAADECVFAFDPETLRFLFANEATCRTLGASRNTVLASRTTDFDGFLLDPARLKELLQPLTTARVRTQSFTTTMRRADGTPAQLEMSLQFLPGGDRFPARCIGIGRDISERLKAEALALRSQRLEALGALAGGIAHDLNNALGPILMSVDLLRANPSQLDLLDTITGSAQRGASMLRQLLAFARGAEGTRGPVHPGRILKDTAKIVQGTFPKNIRLNVAEGALPLIHADPTQVHQVLLNLCLNARDAMPDGGVISMSAEPVLVDEVFASSVQAAVPGKYVALRVADTGSGMPREVLDRIFEPFFTTKGPDKGTGLGLPTVLGIVKAHQGFLQVQSEVGHGSTFSVYLPVDASTDESRNGASAVTPFVGHDETVLFVDDEAPIREVARLVLEKMKLRVLTATDGADALSQVAKHRDVIRAVITDLHMPQIDGVMLASILRKVIPEVPIVIVSGRIDERQGAELTALGVTDRIEKPFSQKALETVLRRVLAIRGSERQ